MGKTKHNIPAAKRRISEGDLTDVYETRSKKLNKQEVININNSDGCVNNNVIFVLIQHKDISKNLKEVNPFLIKKSLKNCCGDVKSAKKLNDGTILVECVNEKQGKQLLKMPFIFGKDGENIEVVTKVHPRLNTVKGVAFHADFDFMNDDEILDGLRDQHVVNVKKFVNKKGSNIHRNIQGVIITFDLCKIPEQIYIGYEIVKIKSYIPNPIQCFNCWKFGHISSKCVVNKICYNCAEIDHNDADNCKNDKKCVNCNETTHNVKDKKECFVYKREFEIQKIKIEQRVSLFQAKSKYYQMYSNLNQNKDSFVNVVKENTHKEKKMNCTCICTCNSKSKDNNENTKNDSSIILKSKENIENNTRKIIKKKGNEEIISLENKLESNKVILKPNNNFENGLDIDMNNV